jgi:hypothetical protein
MKLRSGNTIGEKANIKLNFSKMPKKATSATFVVIKTTDEKLKEAMEEIENLKAELKKLKENTMFVATQMHHINLWQSGLNDLAEHLGHDPEYFDKTWMEQYNKGGLEGLKGYLRVYAADDCRNKGYYWPCSECNRLIDRMLQD